MKPVAAQMKIALDFSGAVPGWMQLDTWRGVLRYASERANWSVYFNDPQMSIRHHFTTGDDLIRLGFDGAILTPYNSHLIDFALSHRLPAVCVPSTRGSLPIPGVSADNYGIGVMAAEHFLERGFRHLGFVGERPERPWQDGRRAGFVRTAATRGIDCHVGVFQIGHGVAEEEQAILQENWIHDLPKPVGLFALSDYTALRAVEACESIGARIPDEVAVLGVDNNVLLCESRHPFISSIEMDCQRVGYEAGALLDKLIMGQPLTSPVVTVPAKGVITRRSSDVLAIDDPPIAGALGFIRDHSCDMGMAIEDIVALSGLSRSSLERRFRARFGRSLAAEIRRRRLERAKSLMIETSLPLEEIARRSGFRRASYLAVVFRRAMGTTADTWRGKRGRASE